MWVNACFLTRESRRKMMYETKTSPDKETNEGALSTESDTSARPLSDRYASIHLLRRGSGKTDVTSCLEELHPRVCEIVDIERGRSVCRGRMVQVVM